MKDFFERQDRARSRTLWLVALFGVAVVLTVLAMHLAVTLIVGASAKRPVYGWWEPWLLARVAAATVAIIAAGSFWKIIELSGGGVSVAQMLGGRPVPPNPLDLGERRLRNVVEEMSIASGTPVPQVYVLEDEAAINAFAAGHGPRDTVVAVTRGALDRLTRDELQGVIAHEFSHILNGDVRLNTRLIAILHGVLALAIVGELAIRVATSGRSRYRSSGRRKGGDPRAIIFVLGVAAWVVGQVGFFFGKLIKASVSRQRELLADASAVQFTRNPDGLAGALKKIGGLKASSTLQASRREEASHLYFAAGVPMWFEALFATHPPLVERIKALEPSFGGVFPDVTEFAGRVEGESEREDESGRERGQMGLAGRAEPRRAVDADAGAPGALPAALEVDADDLVRRTGTLGPEEVKAGAGLVRALPATLRRGASEPFVAQAIACALVLAEDADARAAQMKALRMANAGLADETGLVATAVAALDPAARLPLLDLSMPALRQLSRAQFQGLARAIDALLEAGPRISLFAYALRHVLLRHLRVLHDRPPRPPRHHALGPIANDCAVLLSLLAHAGQPTDRRTAESAFRAAAEKLALPPAATRLLPREQTTLVAFDGALDRIAGASGGLRGRILEACARCVAHDGRLTLAEGELVRAIAEALDCPIPPAVATLAARRAVPAAP